MDPPYPGIYNLHDFAFKEEQFLRAIKGLKAMWIVSCTAERAKVFKGCHGPMVSAATSIIFEM